MKITIIAHSDYSRNKKNNTWDDGARCVMFKSCKSEKSSIIFTPREKEVIELFMCWKTYEQIAEYLGISVSGVRRHLERIILQNELKSTIELISKY